MKPSDIIIALDDGHGMATPGKRTPLFPDKTYMHENEFNRAVIKYLDEELQCIGFKTLIVAPTDEDISLETRVGLANNTIKNNYNKSATIYVSIHANAYNGIWDAINGGLEIYHYPNSVEGKKLAQCIHKHLILGTPLIDRGIKQNNFMVLRETKMPAALSECGFMDNRKDAEQLKSDNYRKECAIEHAKGICEYFNIEYKTQKQEVISTGTPILGEAIATLKQAKIWAKDRKATEEFIELADLFWEIAPKLNIRPDIAYAQSAKETAFGRFGGVLNNTYHNTCGLKTSKGGGNYDPNVHQKFPDWETGILAHVQHLAIYAGITVVPPIVDPRHFSFIKGKAKTVEELGGAWAGNPNYGVSIIDAYLKPMINTIVPEEPLPEPIKSNPSEWAKNAWIKAVQKKVIEDKEPQGNVSREMLIQILDNLGLLG